MEAVGNSALLGLVMSWPTEWLIFSVLVIIFTFDSILFGTGKSAALLLAYPLALFLYTAAQSAIVVGATMQQFTAPVHQLVIFAIFLAASWWLVHRAISVFDGPVPILVSALFGLTTAIGLVVYLILTPPLEPLWQFSNLIQTVFGEAYRFWWLIVSYFVLAYVRS